MALHSTIFTLLFFSLEKLQRRDVKWVQRKGQMFIWITNYIFSQVDWEMLHQLSIVWLYCLKVKTKTELRTEVTQADPERLPADWIIWVKYEYHKEQVRNNTRNHLRDQQELPETVWQTGHLKKHCGQGDRVINHQKLFHCSKAYHRPFLIIFFTVWMARPGS